MIRCDNMVAYYGKDDWPSNFHPTKLNIVLSHNQPAIKANTAEHAFQMCKAAVFGDFRTLEKIRLAPTPLEAKALGRMVSGFDEEIWNRRSVSAMMHVLKAKLDSNPELKELARGFKGCVFIEASPRDFRWGCGLSKTHEQLFNPLVWKGKNLHGDVWTRLIEQI